MANDMNDDELQQLLESLQQGQSAPGAPPPSRFIPSDPEAYRREKLPFFSTVPGTPDVRPGMAQEPVGVATEPGYQKLPVPPEGWQEYVRRAALPPAAHTRIPGTQLDIDQLQQLSRSLSGIPSPEPVLGALTGLPFQTKEQQRLAGQMQLLREKARLEQEGAPWMGGAGAPTPGAPGGPPPLIKGIGEYRTPPAALGGFAGKQGQKLMSEVLKYYPDYKASTWTTANKMRQDFANPRTAPGFQINAINTGLDHLDHLWDAGAELQNAPLKLWNAIKLMGIDNVGDPRVAKFRTFANFIAPEVAKVAKGTAAAPTKEEIAEQMKNFSKINSPEQMQAVIQSTIQLFSGRIRALSDQWEGALPGIPMDQTLLSPRARASIKKMGLDPEEILPSLRPGAAPSEAAPKGVTVLMQDPQTKRTYQVPADQIEKYRTQGAVVISPGGNPPPPTTQPPSEGAY